MAGRFESNPGTIFNLVMRRILMNQIQYFLWLVTQTLEGFIYAWPITVLLIGSIFWAWRYQLKRENIVPVYVIGWALFPIILTTGILITGVVYKSSSSLMSLKSSWPELLVDGLFLAHIPVGVALMIRFKSYKWILLTFSLFFFFSSFWAFFVSNCSISGDWP